MLLTILFDRTFFFIRTYFQQSKKMFCFIYVYETNIRMKDQVLRLNVYIYYEVTYKDHPMPFDSEKFLSIFPFGLDFPRK